MKLQISLQDRQRGFLEWWLDKYEEYPNFDVTVGVVKEALELDGYNAFDKNILNNLLKRYENDYVLYFKKSTSKIDVGMFGEIYLLHTDEHCFEAKLYNRDNTNVTCKRFRTYEEANSWINLNTL